MQRSELKKVRIWDDNKRKWIIDWNSLKGQVESRVLSRYGFQPRWHYLVDEVSRLYEGES